MRCLLHLALAFVVTGCGEGDSSPPDQVTAACGRMADASCAKFVECKAIQGGVVMTASVCEQIRSRLIDSCRTKSGSAISSSNDGEIDACVQGFEEFQCSNVCGQVPQDPAVCQKFSPTPNTQIVTCAP